MTLLTEPEARSFVEARCSEVSLKLIDSFVGMLKQANQSQNLVSPQSLDSIWLRHIADSAQLLDHVPRETGNWMDIGTGAGLPGLVLAIINPNRHYVLVEPRKLRVQWLSFAVSELQLSNCTVLGSDIAKVESFESDVISARAVASLQQLIALSARFSTTTTRWVLPKGRSAAQEVAALPMYQRKMFHVEQSRTSRDAGIVVGVGKVEVSA